MSLIEITGEISALLWSQSLIYILMAAGIYFSVRMTFPQVRLLKDMVVQLLGGKNSKSGVSSYQAFAMALGGRVGIGNIAGVATAIFYGGPGAIFWMWLIAFFGAGSAFVESALAQVWKEDIGGEYSGGPAFYIEKGLKSKLVAIIFTIAVIIACGFTGPGVQAFNIADSFMNAFGIAPLYTGIGVAALFAIVLFGGVKRIGKFAEIVVPIMSIAYIIIALIILVVNFTKIPAMFTLIFSSAFNMNATFGGIFGSAVLWGIKRGLYSNEAGQGTGAIAAGAAEVSHPAKQGLAQAFSVYIDTLFVCTATAIMILSTGMYNVSDKNGGFIVNNLPNIEPGVGFTQAAIDTILPGLGGPFIAIAVFFFAFTTLLSFGYYAMSNVAYLYKNNKNLGTINNIVRVVQVIMVVIASVKSSEFAWNLADIGVGMLAWINIISILVLGKYGFATLKDYEEQKKMGIDPVFIPERCGIDNAPIWHKIAKEIYPEELARLKEKLKIISND